MPQPHPPFLHDLITTLAASTQLLSQRNGEIASSADRPTAEGFIYGDVRVLSGLSLTVNGEPADHIATLLDGNRTQFVFCAARG
jgi:N-terminal domain of (some) glycogen debranching enzymes